jgi:hypothetical protein
MPTGHRQTSAAARIEDPQHAVDVPDDLLVVGVPCFVTRTERSGV